MFEIPILAYHHVVPEHSDTILPWVYNSPFRVTVDQFDAQMRFLTENSYQIIGLDELWQQVHDKESAKLDQLANKSVVITFDDGWKNNIDYALPVLQNYGIKATFYIISKAVGEQEYMSWSDLEKMAAAEMDIQSHGHRHVALELLSDDECRFEFEYSKHLLESNLGHKISHFSFPLGFYNRKVIDIAKKYYKTCATSNTGFVSNQSNVNELPRLMVRHEHSLDDLRMILERDKQHLKHEIRVQKAKRTVKSIIGLKNYLRLHEFVYRTPSTEIKETESA